MNIVIKFGTSTLINEKGEPRKNIYNKIASTVTKLNTENRITIVASGAAMIGSKILNLKERPKRIDELQVAQPDRGDHAKKGAVHPANNRLRDRGEQGAKLRDAAQHQHHCIIGLASAHLIDTPRWIL